MSRRKKSLNPLQHLSKFLTLLSILLGRAINFLTSGLLKTIRRLLPRSRNRRRAPAGFVLPTIVMVSLVVVLVTTAVMIRSFDRSKNASNFRANEAVLNAATPALDRARAKITRLFSPDETNLPVGTPNDIDIKTTLEAGLPNYTFKDEDNLVLSLAGQQDLKTAWRYPVDTNNNGKFDSYTLYGIYFRTPLDANSKPQPRTALDARANPMDDGQSSSCNAGSTQIGGWAKTGSGALKKAFFTYVATVPISEEQAKTLGGTYEPFIGNPSFSALEMQQDQVRISLDNNAVFYEDDLGITFSPQFFINGRVHTNGNLLVSAPVAGNEVVFLQVSSPFSCFYKPENSLISVGGNVAPGSISQDTDGAADLVKVHLFRGESNNPTLKDNASGNPAKNPFPGSSINGLSSTVPNFYNKTTDKNGGKEVAYNDLAYQKRLTELTTGSLALFDVDPEKQEQATPEQVDAIASYPQEVKDSFRSKNNPNKPLATLLRNVLETYFKERLRRVPFAEIPINKINDATKINGAVLNPFVVPKITDETGKLVIAPPVEWMDPSFTYTKLNPRYLPATDPLLVDPKTKQNDYLGDRLIVGNNLPYRWFNNTGADIAGPPKVKIKQFAKPGSEKPISNVKWLQPAQKSNPNISSGESGPRKQSSRIIVLDDIADTSRSGFWEDAAANQEAKITVRKPDGKTEEKFIPDEVRGGLRVITGAGLYLDGCPTEAPAAGFPTGFPCNGAKGLGLRKSDPKATIATVRSFLPKPPQFQKDTTDDYYLLPLLKEPVVNAVAAPALPDGEHHIRVKLPVGSVPAAADEKPITVWPDSMPMWEDRNLDGKWDIDGWNKTGLVLADIQDTTTNNFKLDLKGDLQMRASVVYHYKSGTPDLPLACVSSYYDPSNTISANASDGLVTTTDRRANGKAATPLLAGTVTTATNGRSYTFANNSNWRDPSGDDLEILQRQTAMVFPDGRLVNEPLRTALQKAAADRTLADKAAIDAAMCALKILDGTAIASPTDVPHGVIKEATMVDARQIKAIHKLNVGTTATAVAANAKVNIIDNLSNPSYLKIAQTYEELTLDKNSGEPNLYNLPIEQRQPMEVRMTEIDLELLRKTKIGPGAGSGEKDTQEYLLPNSGIIYATRDDALPDLSDIKDDKLDSSVAKYGYRTNARLNKDLADKPSASDFKLDPTRRPHGIRLIRGSNLSRVNTYRQAEKGLTLATNVPVYVKADDKNAFNLHANPGSNDSIEEFTEKVSLNKDAVNAGNFYARQTKNTNFACRSGQPGCGVGDQWRAARIIADSITLLSNSFYDGVRSDGSFDQNNNGGNSLVASRLKNGFLWNSFGTSSKAASVVTPDATNQSSYWTNGVTPIQRRVSSGAPVYKMEICLKLPVISCKPEDWKQDHRISSTLTINAGTTATLPTPSTPDPLFQSILRFPRRVAFDRNNSDGSILLKDANDDLILGTIDDGTTRKLVTIKTPATATNRGTIPLTSTLNNASSLTEITPQIKVDNSGATGPTLWFGSGSQQKLKLETTPTPAGSPAKFTPPVAADIPTDFAPSPAGAFFQQYLPKPDTTVTPNTGVVGLPQFLAALDKDLPGANTMAEAAKYSFCIATTPVIVAPATTADPLAPGAGASKQLVVRTQTVTTPATPGYLAPGIPPTEGQSTIPIPKTTDSMPPTATKPFEPYDPVPTDTAWTTPTGGSAAPAYGGIDAAGTGVKPCIKAVSDAIELFRTGLLTPPVDITLTDFTTPPATPAGAVTITSPVAPATSPIKVLIKAIPPASAGARKITYIDLGNTSTGLPIPAGTEITLQKGIEELADKNPLFVIRGLSPEGITIGNTTAVSEGVKLVLDGVDPNNVFWVSSRGMTIADASPTPAPTAGVPNPSFLGHQLAGNFLGRNELMPPPVAGSDTSPLSIGNNTKVTAGRFLGFTGSNLRETRTTPIPPETAPVAPATLPGSVPPKKTMEIWAMNSVPPTYEKLTNQPIMAPVLNIHSPGAATTPAAFGAPEDRLDSYGWIPRTRIDSTFNAVLVMGDSPARPIDPPPTTYVGNANVDRGENNGGLLNFPRFLEAWEKSQDAFDVTTRIAGSLVQYKKSSFASAPYEAINNPDIDTSLFFATPAYTAGLDPRFKGFRYPGGGTLFRVPYLRSPFRAWGYDVGLLSQSADLFSKRFSLPSTARPSEFFREVSRDDTWVKTLLCAKVATAAGTAGSPAVDAKQKPSGCI